MIRERLIHPGILSGLASAGHGSQVLVADALYPHATGALPGVQREHLNLTPGLVAAPDVIGLIADTVHIEAATYMETAEGGASSPVREYQNLLAEHRHAGDAEIAWNSVERKAFYDLCRSPNVCMLIATGDVRPYANLLLTIGVP